MQERITVAPDLIGITPLDQLPRPYGSESEPLTLAPAGALSATSSGRRQLWSSPSVFWGGPFWSAPPPTPRSPAARGRASNDEADRPEFSRVVAYTDGACSGNPGPGGWAWAVSGGRFATGAERHTTNQRMEVTAAYQAVLAHDGPIEVVSDSTYVVNCFKQRWWEGWLKRGWTNSQRKPVANRDLWEPFIDLVRTRGNVTFRWVKGHSEDRMNQFVDQLAVEASQSQASRTGRCP